MGDYWTIRREKKAALELAEEKQTPSMLALVAGYSGLSQISLFAVAFVLAIDCASQQEREALTRAALHTADELARLSTVIRDSASNVRRPS